MPQEPFFEEHWDKRKIMIGLVIFGALLGFGGYKIIPYMQNRLHTLHAKAQQEVAGANTLAQPHFTLPNTSTVQNSVANLEQQALHLNVQDVASSSPQIQQLIKALQNLKQLPENQAKAACMKLCSGI